jgi:hypothetical protein
MNFSLMHPYNTLDIPSVTAPYLVATSGIAAALVPLLFVSRILAEHAEIVKDRDHRPAYGRIFFETGAILLSWIFLYKWIFLKIIALCEIIGMSMYNAGDWSAFVEQVTANNTTSLSLVNLNVTAAFSAFFSTLIQLIEGVFLRIRYLLLSCLYVIGPLAFVCGLSPLTRGFFAAWFTGVFQVSFWVILFNVIRGVLTASQVISSGVYGDSVAGPIVDGAVLTTLTLLIPTIGQTLLSSGHFGTIGSAIYGSVVAASIRYGYAPVSKGVQALTGRPNYFKQGTGQNANAAQPPQPKKRR